jgi:O-antigen ligase
MEWCPGKNAATQSGEFVSCIFGLLFLASEAVARRRWLWLLGFVTVILAMLANVLYVATSRTALVVALVLVVLLAARKLNAKGIALVFSGAVLVGITGWSSSPYLRERIKEIWTDLQKYEAADTLTSSGERLVFWKKSIEFIRQSPVIGHGTGSIHPLFEKSAIGQTGAAGEATANPHNQTLAVGINLALWALPYSGPCGSPIFSCFAAMACPNGSGLSSWCRTSSGHCSTRICSISCKVGSTLLVSVLLEELR